MKLYVYTPIGHRGNTYSVMAETQKESFDAILQLIRDRNGEIGYNEGEFMNHNYELIILYPGEIWATRYAS